MHEVSGFPTFISNDPSGNDLFESRSQERIAKSIAQQLRDNKFQLFGLDGEWGSGKSNVIKIVEKLLTESHHFFIYDAWSHQEDLQRRSFLEELTDNLQKNHIVKQEEWRDKLQHLLSKKKTTSKKTIPKLSNAIIISALVSISVPLLNTITSSFKELHWIWKLLIALSPLLIALLIWVISNWRKNKKERSWKLSDLFYIYREKELNEVTDETISESEPSVREFQNWMWSLSQAIEDSNTKKISDVVIVIDNMDRLPKEKVKALWSSIHIFFSENRYDHISLIVPFDRSHIAKAYSENGDQDDDANHFINKTFNVIFSVSLPVLTDWRNFYQLKFFEAFSDNEETEYNVVQNIFDVYVDTITPRKIIAFINELVSLKIIWGNEIHLRYMAVFILTKKELLLNPLNEIFNNNYIERARFIFKGDEFLMDNIAALVYNVPLERASQVTLNRQIHVNLRVAKSDSLKLIAKHPNFLEILIQVINNEALPAITLVTSLKEIDEGEAEDTKSKWQFIWQLILGRQIDEEMKECQFLSYHQVLLEKVSLLDKKRLINYLISSYQSAQFDGEKYFEALFGLDNFLKQNNIPIFLLDLVEPKVVHNTDFLKYVSFGKEHYGLFKVSTNKEALDVYLASSTSKVFGEATIVSYLMDQYQLTKTKAELERSIGADEVTVENILNKFIAIKALSTDRPLKQELSETKINELLQLSPSNSEVFYELVAMRLARTGAYGVSGGVGQEVLGQVGDPITSGIVKSIEAYRNLGDLIVDYITWQQPLLKSVIMEIVQHPNSASIVNEIKIMQQIDGILASLGMEPEIIFNGLNLWHCPAAGKITVNNIETKLPISTIEKYLFSLDIEYFNSIKNILKEYVLSKDIQKWNVALSDSKSFGFRVLVLLLKNEIIKSLPAQMLDSYKLSLETLAKNKEPLVVQDPESWKLFYSFVDRNRLENTGRNIKDEFVKHGTITKEKFIFFEELLRLQGGLTEHGESGEVIRTIILPISSELEVLEIIAINSEFYINILQDAEVGSEEFVKNVRAVLVRNSNDAIQQFSSELNSKIISPIVVYEAVYVSSENQDLKIDVTENIKDLIEVRKQYHKLVDNSIAANDPHPGVRKKLIVRYKFNDDVRERTINEGSYWSFPY